MKSTRFTNQVRLLPEYMMSLIYASVFLNGITEAAGLGSPMNGVMGYLAKTPGLCLIHALTGLQCPGCGMIRAFIALGRFDVVRAFHLNLLSPFVFTSGLAWVFVRFTGRRWRLELANPMTLVGVLLYGLLRNF